MEILRGTQYHGFPFQDTFLLVRPLSRKLYGGFNGFSAGIHWENHVISKHVRYLLGESPKYGVVECTRRQSQLLRLLY